MSEQGPFDRLLEPSGPRDRTARLVLLGLGLLGAVLLVLVLLPGSPLNSGGGESRAADTTRLASGVKLPKVPEGYQALSTVRTLEKPRGVEGPFAITVDLVEPVTDGRNLGLYTSRAGKWERVAAATLVNNGHAARGEVADMPANVAVLRRTGSAALISGWLAPGAQVDPQALDLVGTINAVVLTPKPDGTVEGTASPPAAQGKSFVPTVRAATAAEIEAVNTVLSSPQTRGAHVSALVAIAQQPGISGIDLDYQRVARKVEFTAFVNDLSERLHSANKTLTISLPAPIKTGVQWDEGAYDWEEIARRVDAIRLVPEADPSAFYKRTEEVANFLKPKIDLRKVMLVISRQSREKGSDGIRQLSLREALALASAIEVRTTAPVAPNSAVAIVGKNIYQEDGATGLQWDTQAFAVSFSFPGRGGQRTVWFENSLSLAFRLDFARRAGFGGVAIEDISLDPGAAAFWEPLRAYAETGGVALSQPNGMLLRPVWQSQAGQIEAGQKGNVVWKAPPQPGVYDVSLIVSDGVVRGAQKVVIEVRAAGAGPTATPAVRPSPSPTPRP